MAFPAGSWGLAKIVLSGPFFGYYINMAKGVISRHRQVSGSEKNGTGPLMQRAGYGICATPADLPS